jgi:hypothetical protein
MVATASHSELMRVLCGLWLAAAVVLMLNSMLMLAWWHLGGLKFDLAGPSDAGSFGS